MKGNGLVINESSGPIVDEQLYQRVEEQAIDGAADRRIRPLSRGCVSPLQDPRQRLATRISDTYRMILTISSTRRPSQIFGSGLDRHQNSAVTEENNA